MLLYSCCKEKGVEIHETFRDDGEVNKSLKRRIMELEKERKEERRR